MLFIYKKTCCFVIALLSYFVVESAQFEIKSLTHLANKTFSQLLEFGNVSRELKKTFFPDKETKKATIICSDEVENVVNFVIKSFEQQLSHGLWFGNLKFGVGYPYVQKVIVPQGSQICVIGDIHGGIHSLLRILLRLKRDGYVDDNFMFKRSDFYMVFLGDYVDRGAYGVEVLYTLMRLKIANPEHVFLLRGNHETRCVFDTYGFKLELEDRYKQTYEKMYQSFSSLFEFLPQVVFIGSYSRQKHIFNFIQCCHALIDYRFDPKFLIDFDAKKLKHKRESVRYQNLLNLFDQEKWENNISILGLQNVKWIFDAYANNNDRNSGFLWFDMFNKKDAISLSARGLAWGEDLVKRYITMFKPKTGTINAIFKGHQDHIAGGVSVWKVNKYEHLNDNKQINVKDYLIYHFMNTFGCMGYDMLPYACDAYGILTIADKYEDWKLTPHEIIIPEGIDTINGAFVSYDDNCNFTWKNAS